jgi:DNA polymerase delta subunit 1
MMAHNLCYTTLISVKDISRLGYTEGKEYERTPTGVFFVKSEIKKGILP